MYGGAKEARMYGRPTGAATRRERWYGKDVVSVPRVSGMGDTLTDWACESATFAASWRGRLNESLDTATVAAVVGAGAGGLLGALLKKPLLGLGVGAITGWAAAAIWTAPLRP